MHSPQVWPSYRPPSPESCARLPADQSPLTKSNGPDPTTGAGLETTSETEDHRPGLVRWESSVPTSHIIYICTYIRSWYAGQSTTMACSHALSHTLSDIRITVLPYLRSQAFHAASIGSADTWSAAKWSWEACGRLVLLLAVIPHLWLAHYFD